jgi:heat shock protein HslJ
LQGTWVASALPGEGESEPVDPQRRVEITLAEGTATGRGGVNRFHTVFETSDGAGISFGVIAATRMAGPEAAMARERAFFAALESAVRFEVTEDELVLLDQDGRPLVLLIRN